MASAQAADTAVAADTAGTASTAQAADTAVAADTAIFVTDDDEDTDAEVEDHLFDIVTTLLEVSDRVNRMRKLLGFKPDSRIHVKRVIIKSPATKKVLTDISHRQQLTVRE